MLLFTLPGMEIAVDFTAPALLALLSLALPAQAFAETLFACILHESAHLLAIYFAKQRVERLHVSAAGLRLTLRGAALCPTRPFCAVMLAGAGANVFAGALFLALGCRTAAWAQLSLAVFNLLPFRATDGGTLLYALLENRFCIRYPALSEHLMRLLAVCTAALTAFFFCRNGVTALSVWGMLGYMLLAELTAGDAPVQMEKLWKKY